MMLLVATKVRDLLPICCVEGNDCRPSLVQDYKIIVLIQCLNERFWRLNYDCFLGRTEAYGSLVM